MFNDPLEENPNSTMAWQERFKIWWKRHKLKLLQKEKETAVPIKFEKEKGYKKRFFEINLICLTCVVGFRSEILSWTKNWFSRWSDQLLHVKAPLLNLPVLKMSGRIINKYNSRELEKVINAHPKNWKGLLWRWI